MTHSQCGRQQFRGGDHVAFYGSRDTGRWRRHMMVRAGRGESRLSDGRVRSGSRPDSQITCSGGIARWRPPGWDFGSP